jgi:hypothetical protein
MSAPELSGPLPAGWTDNLGVQWQLDAAGVPLTFSEWIDNVKLTITMNSVDHGQAARSCSSSTVVTRRLHSSAPAQGHDECNRELRQRKVRPCKVQDAGRTNTDPA